MNQIFQDITPVLGGMKIDLTTVLSAIVFLWLLILGFDLIKIMIGGRIMNTRLGRAADYWEEQDRIYKKLLNRSADLRVRGWKD